MYFNQIDLPMKIKYANTFWGRLIGLQFQKKPIIDEGLLITKCNSIHMFFMRFPIDVVFLDQSNQVIKVVPHLRPWRIVPPVETASSTLELPIGTIVKRNISVGDTINL